MERRAFGIRQLLGAVNLRDFLDMVRGELAMLNGSLRVAFAALPRLPFGPLLCLGGLLLVLVRLVLLIVVVITFGISIAVISLVRLVTGGGRRRDA